MIIFLTTNTLHLRECVRHKEEKELRIRREQRYFHLLLDQLFVLTLAFLQDVLLVHQLVQRDILQTANFYIKTSTSSDDGENVVGGREGEGRKRGRELLFAWTNEREKLLRSVSGRVRGGGNITCLLVEQCVYMRR